MVGGRAPARGNATPSWEGRGSRPPAHFPLGLQFSATGEGPSATGPVPRHPGRSLNSAAAAPLRGGSPGGAAPGRPRRKAPCPTRSRLLYLEVSPPPPWSRPGVGAGGRRSAPRARRPRARPPAAELGQPRPRAQGRSCREAGQKQGSAAQGRGQRGLARPRRLTAAAAGR